jgi:biopolymer transport protein ExbB
MKQFHAILLTGLIVHFLPFSVKHLQAEEPASFAFVSETQDLSLDEQISSLDQEFNALEEQLTQIEETTQNGDLPQIVAPEETAKLESIEIVSEIPDLSFTPSENPLLSEQTESFVAEIPAIESPLQHSLEEMKLPEESIADLPTIETLSTPIEIQKAVEPLETHPILATSMISERAVVNKQAITVDLSQAFNGSPIIYSLLLAMSMFSVCIWLYSLFSIRFSARISPTLLKNVQNNLTSNNFDEVRLFCEENNTIFSKMLLNGIQSRRHGLPVMVEAMKAEGKRATISFWQKIGLLNDIAIIAPMLGLLGTVLGMFYAFYDINRSTESVSNLFDGLGISVGTTVAGLVVAILSLILHSTAKYRLVRALAKIENEAQHLALLMDDRTSIYKG